MILGFTGTRRLPTSKQLTQLDLYLFDNDIDEAHHGACVGSDLAFHRAALWFALSVIVHPPIKEMYLAFECLNTVSEPPDVWDITILAHKEYHERNRDIVNDSDQLLALPEGPRRPHSGTWWTIDYALEHDAPVDIIWPDGRLEVGYQP
jgi:hypothetical protein